MDVFDQATELERLDRESALMRARAAIDRGGPEIIDGVACCRDCGDPIPQKRLEPLPGVGLCRILWTLTPTTCGTGALTIKG